MGGNPELTPAVLAELRAALLRRQAELRQLIADLPLENVGYDAPGDSGDSSIDLQNRDDTHELLLALRAQLNEVEHALTKFENGTYGICERCGRPIPLARLRVLPEARYDVEYAEDVEAGTAPR